MKPQPTPNTFGLWLAIGAGLGAALSVSLGPAGLALGVGLGALVAFLARLAQRRGRNGEK